MQSILDELNIFVVYGNAKNEFISLNNIVKQIHRAKSLIIQKGYSNPEIHSTIQNKIFNFCSESDFKNYLVNSDIIISHAGVGIIS